MKSSAKEYTVCVAVSNGVSRIPEYSGLLYMPSHCSCMACEDLLPRGWFMSTSWWHLRLMSASFSFSALAITYNVWCLLQGLAGGRWSVCRGKNFPKPIITQKCLNEAHLYPIINSGCLSTWWLCAYLLLQVVPLWHIPTNLAPYCQPGPQAMLFLSSHIP